MTEARQYLIDTVNKMSNEGRKELREELEAMGMEDLPRNLYYNYETQEWIN